VPVRRNKNEKRRFVIGMPLSHHFVSTIGNGTIARPGPYQGHNAPYQPIRYGLDQPTPRAGREYFK
jgi:hypothetical protein